MSKLTESDEKIKRRFYDIPARDAFTDSKDKEALDKQCL